MSTKYCKHLGNGVFDPRLFATQGENCYPYEPTVPPHTESQLVFTVGFKWLVEGSTATGIYEVKDISPAPGEGTRYSVRAIIRELKSSGKYDAVRSLLETTKYDWEFVGSNYLASDDADFQRMLSAIVQQGILSRQEMDDMLPKCIWSAE